MLTEAVFDGHGSTIVCRNEEDLEWGGAWDPGLFWEGGPREQGGRGREGRAAGNLAKGLSKAASKPAGNGSP